MEILEYFQGRQAFRRLGYIDFAYKDLLGSTNAALLLTQIEYWYVISGGDFYKFRSPCGHKLYKKGDSWCEELHLTEQELKGAIKKLKELELVTTKTDISRLTTWTFNAEKVFEYLREYEQKQHLNNSQKSFYEKDKKAIIKELKEPFHNGENNHYVMDKKAICSITENTTKLTTKNTAEHTQKMDEPNGSLVAVKKAKKIFLETDFHPSFIDVEIWNDFCAYKKERKESFTETGLKQFYKKLESFHAKGFNVNEILQETMANGWRGVFGPKKLQYTGKLVGDDLLRHNAEVLNNLGEKIGDYFESKGLDRDFDPATLVKKDDNF